MSDSVRRFDAIRQALNSLYPEVPRGHLARHLTTLTAMIAGMVANKSVHFSRIAQAHTDDTRGQSRVMKYSRFVQNEQITLAVHFLPYIRPFLAALAQTELILAIDTSVVGRGCLCLMVSLVYKNRAIPLCWTVTDQKKGHLPCDTHLDLLEVLKDLLPSDRAITLVGDGEFDGFRLVECLKRYQWQYVLRTGKDSLLLIDGTWTRFDAFVPEQADAYSLHHEVFFTQSGLCGPLHALCYWDRRFQDPLFLITSYPSADKAMSCYRKRAKIETFFSDQKSRGFHLHKSHMSDPKRLTRLLIPAALAYIWIIYLGELADKAGLRGLFERKDRADLSLFQLGLHLLAHLLNHDLPVLVSFQLNPPVPQSLITCVG